MKKIKNKRNGQHTNWDAVANWYDSWMGKQGSVHHRHLAVPTVMKMLQPTKQEHVLDVGCGQGVLAESIVQTGARYTGVDASHKLLALAKKRHAHLRQARFLFADATKLDSYTYLKANLFQCGVFLLSIQDMSPLDKVLQSVSGCLEENGRLVILMTHPCFRIPRQSGWGWDKQRKLRYRRIDNYLTKLKVPMKTHKHGTTRSYHRPLETYFNELGNNGFMIDQIREIPVGDLIKTDRSKAEKRADMEFPLFLAIRARKIAS
ncbi:MAG: methyltransferase domain-containing protein [Chloroflexota bacterium]